MLQTLFTTSIRRFLVSSAPWLIVAVLGIILALSSAYGAYWTWGYQPLIALGQTERLETQAATSSAKQKLNTVEISGAVLKPGVYEVTDGSRWQEVVLMANGFEASADKKFIHQDLNLAEKVKDQTKLYVPYASESSGLKRSEVANEENNKNTLFVNTAPAKIWDEIEGIGEAKTKSILAGVPYTDKNDFLDRSGISSSLYKNIEEKYSEIIY